MENIFGKIIDALSGNKKIPLEGELLAEAEKLWEVKNSAWTPEQIKRFSDELKGWKQGSATMSEKKVFFEKLEASLKPQDPPGDEKTKIYKYRAVRNCVVDGIYRREGEIIFLAEKSEVPHFEFVEEEKK